MRKPNFAGFGLFANTLTIPAGKDNIMSPDIFTWHRDSSLPLRNEIVGLESTYLLRLKFKFLLEIRMNNFVKGYG